MPARPTDKDWLRRVGANLARARQDAGLTQEAAAAQLGMERAQTLGNWELGRANFSIGDLRNLAELYGRSTDWIMDFARSPQIRSSDAIIDLAAERAVLAATTLDELRPYAEAEIRSAEEAVSIGFRMPREYVIVSEKEFETRLASTRRVLARLQPKGWFSRVRSAWDELWHKKGDTANAKKQK